MIQMIHAVLVPPVPFRNPLNPPLFEPLPHPPLLTGLPIDSCCRLAHHLHRLAYLGRRLILLLGK